MDLNVVVGGPQGGGVETAGQLLIRLVASHGLEVIGVREYHSNIKGKHSYYQVRFSDRVIGSIRNPVDVLGGIDAETIATHFQNVKEGGTVVVDDASLSRPLSSIPSMDPHLVERVKSHLKAEGETSMQDVVRLLEGRGARVLVLPLSKMTSELVSNLKVPQPSVARALNTAVVSAISSILGADRNILQSTVDRVFAGREAVTRVNLAISEAVQTYMSDAYHLPSQRLPKVQMGTRLLVSGNDAVALGKVVGGARVQTYYPITPAADESFTIEDMGEFPVGAGGTTSESLGYALVVQTEDEIAAIAASIGAALAGARASTSTSGPGFSLMVEGLGWAGMNEVPVVVTYYQRGGPSTGLPTRHSQSDLLFSIFAGHGEFAKVVLASGGHSEAFYDAAKAFNYAERFQIPVIHLLDKGLANALAVIPEPSLDQVSIDRGLLAEASPDYRRFRFTESGVSPRAFLGKAVMWYTGDEHDELGHISEDPVVRSEMYGKRLKKGRVILDAVPEDDKVVMHGPDSYDDLFLTWGSSTGAVTDAVISLRDEGAKVSALQVRLMEPFDSELVSRHLRRAFRVINVEANYLGLLGELVKMRMGLDVKFRILKWTGRVITEDEVVHGYRRIVTGGGDRVALLSGE